MKREKDPDRKAFRTILNFVPPPTYDGDRAMHNREDQQQLIVNFRQIFLVVNERKNENDDEEN